MLRKPEKESQSILEIHIETVKLLIKRKGVERSSPCSWSQKLEAESKPGGVR